MKSDTVRGILLLLIAAILFFCISCGKKEEAAPAAAKATTISLKKTKGSVNIDDQEGKSIEPIKNLKLYSGYDLFTKETSYAWINLDQAKLAKMDEESEIKIQKDEKRLEIHVSSGSLFFHVKEPLKDGEQMNIRTSTMAVGIRGTCGWVTKENDLHSQVYILEGTVTVRTSDGQTANVRAGQMADVTRNKKGKPKIVVSEFTVDDIPKFVLAELRRDKDLAETIREASGLDVLNPDTEEDSTSEETENTENPEETQEPQEPEEATENEAEETTNEEQNTEPDESQQPAEAVDLVEYNGYSYYKDGRMKYRLDTADGKLNLTMWSMNGSDAQGEQSSFEQHFSMDLATAEISGNTYKIYTVRDPSISEYDPSYNNDISYKFHSIQFTFGDTVTMEVEANEQYYAGGEDDNIMSGTYVFDN